MPQNRTKYQFYQEASLSQKLSDKDPLFREITGNDPDIANAIGSFIVLDQLGIIDFQRDKKGTITNPDWALIMGLLEVQLKVSFACSEKTNEITKMGLRMPKAEDIISTFDEEE